MGRKRAAVAARCEQLRAELEVVDAHLAVQYQRRRELASELRDQRRRLWPRLAFRARQPGPDGSVQLPPIARDALFVRGRRLRAVCHAILARVGPLSLIELHALLHRNDFAVAGTYPVKALADAMGHEVDVGRARRIERGVYESKRMPSSRPLWRGGPSIRHLEHD